jgi:hypothetical protein
LSDIVLSSCWRTAAFAVVFHQAFIMRRRLDKRQDHGTSYFRCVSSPNATKLRDANCGPRCNAALALPEVAERLVPAGASEPYITTLDGFNAIIRRDYETYGQGVTVD